MIFPSTLLTFGVLSESLMDGSGGVFLGLIRDTDTWIRPSFLGQTKTKSFQIDLRRPREQCSLTLSTNRSWNFFLNDNNNNNDPVVDRFSIPLVNDLNRKYGDPVLHYVAKMETILVNGRILPVDRKKPIYVIIDTGVTGMVVSEELWNIRYETARRNKEKGLWNTVDIVFSKGDNGSGDKNDEKQLFKLNAVKPITTTLANGPPWPSTPSATR